MFGIMENHKKPDDPARMNEIVLAYLGDCVYELYVRNLSVETGQPKVYVLNKMSSEKSKASYQSEALKNIEHLLTENENAIVKRAKNKKITSKPKNADPRDYKRATAFEALIGYLYLMEDYDRMEQIIRISLEGQKGDGVTE